MSVIQDAIDYIEGVRVQKHPKDNERYRQACVSLVEHKAELTQNVFIIVTGGEQEASHPDWGVVCANSESLCSCGTVRVIHPDNLRMQYERSSADPMVISKENPVYLRPIGGIKTSALVKLSIKGARVGVLEDPFRMFLLQDLFSSPGADLEKIDQALKNKSLITVVPHMGSGQPIFEFVSVDMEANTATIVLDKAIECFDPDAESEFDHPHD